MNMKETWVRQFDSAKYTVTFNYYTVPRVAVNHIHAYVPSSLAEVWTSHSFRGGGEGEPHHIQVGGLTRNTNTDGRGGGG